LNKTGFVLTFFIFTMAISLPETSSISSSTCPNRIHNVLASESSPSKNQLENASLYLMSMYNPKLGLVANSEDRGPNPYEDGVPCCNTYWVYSDNLWAGWALQPFDRSIAENITKTVQRYTAKYGRSMLFEAIIGEPIPTTIHDKKNIKVLDEVVERSRVQVLLDRHQYADNLGVFHDAEEYADLCFYMTINYWMMGDTGASMHWFSTGERIWNYTTNKGFYDKAAKNDGRYKNYKLGLFLLAQRVTGFESDITGKVEAAAWSYQKKEEPGKGGITTESWLDGSHYGTANTETTSALLLAYSEQLIDRLRKRQAPAKSRLEEEVSVLRDRPWVASPWPPWFTVLMVSTVILATTTAVLAFWVSRLKSNSQSSLFFGGEKPFDLPSLGFKRDKRRIVNRKKLGKIK